MGLLSILAVGVGVAACASRRSGTAAAALLATNYIWVMWNRAALMETTMVAWIAISWSAYALAYRRPIWGVVAGASAILAFFTKAAAAFYVGAIGLEAVIAVAGVSGSGLGGRAMGVGPWGSGLRGRSSKARPQGRPEGPTPGPHRRRSGRSPDSPSRADSSCCSSSCPYWQEFRFYNWQMSVTRKPTYGLHALVDRASWLPVVHDFFTRQWLITVAALAGLPGPPRAMAFGFGTGTAARIVDRTRDPRNDRARRR